MDGILSGRGRKLPLPYQEQNLFVTDVVLQDSWTYSGTSGNFSDVLSKLRENTFVSPFDTTACVLVHVRRHACTHM